MMEAATARSIEPTADGFYELVVDRVIEETSDARSYVLAISDELRETFAYVAGQFCSFRVDIDGKRVTRCYSMASSPDTETEFKITVKRVPGGQMSNWMNDRIQAGDALEVVPPSGRFCLQRDPDGRERPIVAFSGGSGITPVISVIKTALRTTSRSITLLYANRDRASVIFHDELAALAQSAPDRLRVLHWFDVDRGFAAASDVLDLVAPGSDADFFVCGPGPFMDVVETALKERAIERERIFIERFIATRDTDVEPWPEPDALQAVPETVTIVLKGKKATVPYTAGDTILETARREKLSPPFSCQMGNCGTCMAQVTTGAARMKGNNVLTPEEVEEGLILTCQAVPISETFKVEYL